MIFYLGTHEPSWLERANVPLFINRNRLVRRKRLPRASAPWALDSGGFTEMEMHGLWRHSASQYAAEVRRYRDEIGYLQWASIQDWMCEAAILRKTGLTVREHQRRTLESWCTLRELAPDLPWIPVLQGWTRGEYIEHAAMYEATDPMWKSGTVGLGSVCRRQATLSAATIIAWLADDGLQLHGFGFKTGALMLGAGKRLASADSLAWSYNAFRNPPRPQCVGKHKTCSNCFEFAMEWRQALIEKLECSSNNAAC